MNQKLKFALDMGPLAAFIVGFYLFGIRGATVMLMVTTFISLGIIYAIERRLALAPLITGVMVGVFGGITLILQDDYYIKIKPTVVNLILATVLLVGVRLGRPLLKYVLQPAFQLDDAGWRQLSINWGLFFIFLAVVNEVVWRHFSTEFWVNFKLFGMFTMNILFWVFHYSFLQRHLVKEEG